MIRSFQPGFPTLLNLCHVYKKGTNMLSLFSLVNPLNNVYITFDYMFTSLIVNVRLPIFIACVAVRKNLVLQVNPIAQNKIRT